MRVDKQEFVCEFFQLSRSCQTRRVCMRVDKREFVWQFSQLSCPGQTRTRVAWELMRIDKREFVWEFSQLSCPGQTKTRVAWELMRGDKREFVWEFSQQSRHFLFFISRGKTEHEIMKEEPKPSEEPFNRVSSRRFSERVLKGTWNISVASIWKFTTVPISLSSRL